MYVVDFTLKTLVLYFSSFLKGKILARARVTHTCQVAGDFYLAGNLHPES